MVPLQLWMDVDLGIAVCAACREGAEADVLLLPRSTALASRGRALQAPGRATQSG